ncbi:MAG: SOS response-associated peptidase [Polyangiales bacterium]
MRCAGSSALRSRLRLRSRAVSSSTDWWNSPRGTTDVGPSSRQATLVCGRFALNVHGESVFDSFDWLDRGRATDEGAEPWSPMRNIAPTNESLLIGKRPGAKPTLRRMRWGMTTSANTKTRTQINARVETLHARPLFRRAFQRGRCLVPATGYYEWFDAGEGKKPYYAVDARGQLLLMAGLYERSAAGVFGFVVVTQPSSGTASQYHARMPLLVPAAQRERWLDDPDPRTRLRSVETSLHWSQTDPNKT